MLYMEKPVQINFELNYKGEEFKVLKMRLEVKN
jgi:hypothetical protein